MTLHQQFVYTPFLSLSGDVPPTLISWFIFHIRRFFSVLDIVTWALFSGALYKKINNFVFPIQFFTRRFNSQVAAVTLQQVIPSYQTNYSRTSHFHSANTNDKKSVSKDYCIAHHEDKTRFPSNCRYNIILIGDTKELIQKLDVFCFTYKHLNCVYTVPKYHFSGEIVAISGQLLDNVQRAAPFNHQNRGVDRMANIAKKWLLR